MKKNFDKMKMSKFWNTIINLSNNIQKIFVTVIRFLKRFKRNSYNFAEQPKKAYIF